MAKTPDYAELLLRIAPYAREQLHIELMTAIHNQDLQQVETILKIVPSEILRELDFINYPLDNGAPGGANPSLFPLFQAINRVNTTTNTTATYTPTSIAIVRALLQAGADINDIRVFRGLVSNLRYASPQAPLFSELTELPSQMAATSAEADAAAHFSVTTANENEHRKNFIGFLINNGFNIDFVGKMEDDNNLTSLRQILEVRSSPKLLSVISAFRDLFITTLKEALTPHLGTQKSGGPETIVRQYMGGSIEAPFFSHQSMDLKTIRDTKTLESLGEQLGDKPAAQADQYGPAAQEAQDSFLDMTGIDPTSLKMRVTPMGDELKNVLDGVPDAKELLLRLAPYARKKLHTDLVLAIHDYNLERVNKILQTVPLELPEEMRKLLDFINDPPVETKGELPLLFPLTFAIHVATAARHFIRPPVEAYTPAAIAIVRALLQAGADINDIRVFRELVKNLLDYNVAKPLLSELTEPAAQMATAASAAAGEAPQHSVESSHEIESRKYFIRLLINNGFDIDLKKITETGSIYTVSHAVSDDSKLTSLRDLLKKRSPNLLSVIDQFRKDYKAAHQDLKERRDTRTLGSSASAASAAAATTYPASASAEYVSSIDHKRRQDTKSPQNVGTASAAATSASAKTPTPTSTSPSDTQEQSPKKKEGILQLRQYFANKKAKRGQDQGQKTKGKTPKK